MSGRELTVADVAEMQGLSHRTVQRWFVELERKFGPRIIGRRGKRGVMFTNAEALCSVVPLSTETTSDIRKRVTELEERSVEIEAKCLMLTHRIRLLESRLDPNQESIGGSDLRPGIKKS